MLSSSAFLGIGLLAAVVLGAAYTAGSVVQNNACKASMLEAQIAASKQIADEHRKFIREESDLAQLRSIVKEEAKKYEDTINEERAINIKLSNTLRMRDPGTNTCKVPRTSSTRSTGATKGGGTGVRAFSEETEEFLLSFAYDCDKVADRARIGKSWVEKYETLVNKHK